MRTDSEHEEARWIPHVIAGVAGFCGRHPWLVLCLTLLTCGFSLYLNFAHLEYKTQRNDLLSPDLDAYKRWQEYVAEFGDDDDMIVVVQGKDRGRMQEALERLACEVNKQPAFFDRLFYKVDLRPLRNRALLFLPQEQIREIHENIKKMGLLLEPPFIGRSNPLIGWQMLSVEQLIAQAETRLGAVRSGGPLSQDDLQFFRQVEAICAAATRHLKGEAGYENPWLSILPAPKAGANVQQDLLAQPQFFFSADGTLAFLLVRPRKEKESFTASQKSVEALRAIVRGVKPQFGDLKFGLTGLPVLENDEMVATARDSKLASLLALAGVALLYLVVYRGLRYPLMTVATLLVGTVWALGWTTVTVGHLNILSSAFAVMLIGMGDYGVLWVTRFGQERGNGADFHTATRTTALSVGSGVLTAAVATGLAFYATMLADFKAIAELGWIAGSGVIFCAISCFTVMPALLAFFDCRFENKNGDKPVLSLAEARSRQALWLPCLARRPGLVIGVSLACTGVLCLFAVRVGYDHNLLNLQSQDLESVKWEHTLIDHTAGANWYALSWTDTPEQALALKARYDKLPSVGQVVEVASLVPAGQNAKLPMLADIQTRLQKLPERGKAIPHSLPNVPDLVSVLQRLTTGEGAAGFDDPRLKSLPAGLRSLHDALVACAAAQAAESLQKFDERLARDLADDLHRLRDVSTPAPLAIADLPESLRERYIGKSGKWLLRVFGKECLWDYGPLDHFVKQIRTVDPDAAGKPFTTLAGLRGMKNSFLLAGIYALVAMVLILLLDFRNWKHTLVALAPIAMGLIFSLGIMTLLGLPLNPANMIAFPLILGVGADNGVHVIHDYRSRGIGRRYLLSHATGRGILVAALTTVLGFGTLMISTHRGMSSLGLILTLGVFCCMVTALVFLPALLHIQSIRRQKAEETPDEPQRLAA